MDAHGLAYQGFCCHCDLVDMYLDNNPIYSRTPDRDFHCFYLCEIIVRGNDKKKREAAQRSIRDVIVILKLRHLEIFFHVFFSI